MTSVGARFSACGDLEEVYPSFPPWQKYSLRVEWAIADSRRQILGIRENVLHSVFVLEDHPHTRQMLVDVIAGHENLELVGACDSLTTAKDWFAENEAPTAALIDLGLPDGRGEELLGDISGLPTLCLVMTVFADETHVIRAIEAGAVGYLLKDREPQEITQAILDVIDGGSPISPSIARHILNRFRAPIACKLDNPLTDRESEVLSLIAKGLTYEEIADALELSVHTVTSHIQHIYRKLSVRSRGEAVFEATQLGLVRIE